MFNLKVIGIFCVLYGAGAGTNVLYFFIVIE